MAFRGIEVHDGEIVVPAKVTIKANVTANIKGSQSQVTVNDGVTLTGEIFGAHISTEVHGDGVVTGRTDGLRIDMGSEAGATLGIVHGIFISGYHLGTLSPDNYFLIRAQENGTATVRCGLYLKVGTGGIDYFGMLMGTNDGWASGAPNPSVALGWIKLQVSGADRWIQLYGVAPA